MIARTLTLSLFAALALLGCAADEHQDLKLWMLDESKDLKGRIPPLPEIKPFPIVSYEAADLIDPFTAGKIEPEKKNTAAGGGLQPDMNRFREPLESYPLESLNMVGVIKEKGRLSAIVRAEKSVYTVHVGNYLGQSYGKIVRITDSEIQIRELVQDGNNDWVERTSALQLQEQENKK